MKTEQSVFMLREVHEKIKIRSQISDVEMEGILMLITVLHQEAVVVITHSLKLALMSALAVINLLISSAALPNTTGLSRNICIISTTVSAASGQPTAKSSNEIS